MNTHVEMEYKLLLTKEIYEQMLSDFSASISKQYEQTNYYMMHPLLDSHHYMLRIRHKEDRYELTLKQPHNAIGNIETTISLSQPEATALLHQQRVDNAIIHTVEAMGISISELDTSHALHTLRTDIVLENGILSIDKNTYHTVIDYELEFEVLDPIMGYSQFIAIIAPYAISYQQNCASKIKRLKRTLKKPKNSE